VSPGGAAAATGWCAAGFDRVAAVFEAVIAADGGAGSGFAAFRDGALIVDLYGGYRERGGGEPMAADTLLPVFSGTKGIVATAVAILIDREAIDPEAPVTRYWPEFGAAGKQGIRVRQVLAHTAGLPYPDREVSLELSLDPAAMAGIMAEQAPLWPAGSRVAYHAMSFGWLAAELVRRVDGRLIGEFVRQEIADRAPADVWIGLPESQWTRTGQAWRSPGYRVRNRLDTGESRAYLDRVYGNPPVLAGDEMPWNTERWWVSGSPGGGAMAGAHGMAALYSALLSGSLVGGQTLHRLHQEESHGTDPGTGRPLTFGLGYEVQDTLGTYGPVQVGFGHSGAGGSVHGCWPRLGVSFSYTPCMMRTEGDDGRAYRLLSALHSSLQHSE
jgi:CubicO group peptidase (beta-lactamase class C family)